MLKRYAVEKTSLVLRNSFTEFDQYITFLIINWTNKLKKRRFTFLIIPNFCTQGLAKTYYSNFQAIIENSYWFLTWIVISR